MRYIAEYANPKSSFVSPSIKVATNTPFPPWLGRWRVCTRRDWDAADWHVDFRRESGRDNGRKLEPFSSDCQ